MSLGGPRSQPGTHFSYSDTAYVILGDLLERVGGRPLHLLMRELLHFERMGLVQTHFERHELPPVGQKRAGQYLDGIDGATLDCSIDLSGGGGLIATTEELARFFRLACLFPRQRRQHGPELQPGSGRRVHLGDSGRPRTAESGRPVGDNGAGGRQSQRWEARHRRGVTTPMPVRRHARAPCTPAEKSTQRFRQVLDLF
jgi:CubicO group peptidase (beta-lactamase class C family)